MTNKTYNILSIVAVSIAVLGLTVAFAALSTTLNITGTAKLKQASWAIDFETPTNLLLSTGATWIDNPIGGSVEGTPTVTGTTVSFNAQLNEPGDYAEFTVPVTNNGTIDAILSTVTKSVTGIDSDLLVFTLVDGTDIPLADGSMTLNASETKNVKIRVAYDTDVIASELPIADRDINISVTLLWEQN